MKKEKITNLFQLWKLGQLPGDKVYTIRVHYRDDNGHQGSFIKLGFTRRPLKERVKEFLGAFHHTTKWMVEKCEVLSILHSSISTKVEAFIHYTHEPIGLYTGQCKTFYFEGHTEVYADTIENSNLIKYPSRNFLSDQYIIPYTPHR